MLSAVILDTNLLLLLVVGSANVDKIKAHKRLKEHSPDSYRLLTLLLGHADHIILTPNIVTETSNLLRLGISDPDKSMLCRHFADLLGRSREEYTPSQAATVWPDFIRLGITDSAISVLANDDISILTADFDLYESALRSGKRVVNFNHVREEHDV